MPSPEEKFQALLVLLRAIRIKQLFMFSGVTLLAYDALLTFNREYKYIWKAKWTPSKFIYLIFRYGVLAWQLALFSGFLLGVKADLTLKYCRGMTQADIALSALMHQLAIFAITVRTSVLYQNQRSINLLLGAGFLINFFCMLGLQITIASRQNYSRLNLPLNIGCLNDCDGCEVLARIGWGPIVAFEILLCVLTVYRAIQQGQIFRTRITTVLYRDGFAYFVIMFFCGSLQFVLISAFFDNTYLAVIFWGLIQSVFRGIISVTCCRMILNLRGALTKPSEFDMSIYPTGEQPNISTMRFDAGPKATVDSMDVTSTGCQAASERYTAVQSSTGEIELGSLSQRTGHQERV